MIDERLVSPKKQEEGEEVNVPVNLRPSSLKANSSDKEVFAKT